MGKEVSKGWSAMGRKRSYVLHAQVFPHLKVISKAAIGRLRRRQMFIRLELYESTSKLPSRSSLRVFLILLLVVPFALWLYQDALPRTPQTSYWKAALDSGRDFLLGEQEPLPWWDGGDCPCHGKWCFPEQGRNLSWEDAGGACGRRAWLAGGGQKVISFSLFGNDPLYWRAFGRNLNATKAMYPDWVVWLYTNPRGREDVLCPLLRDFPHLYICDVTNLPSLGNVTSIHNMVWRALPLGDERVSAFFVRDSDSITQKHQLLTNYSKHHNVLCARMNAK
nr:uncharacterized protein LOC113808569 [Penaeus vannamei]